MRLMLAGQRCPSGSCRALHGHEDALRDLAVGRGRSPDFGRMVTYLRGPTWWPTTSRLEGAASPRRSCFSSWAVRDPRDFIDAVPTIIIFHAGDQQSDRGGRHL